MAVLCSMTRLWTYIPQLHFVEEALPRFVIPIRGEQ
jgi:hypothetical protein